MSIRKTISVVIPTFNCGSNLYYCLNSIKWADEIIVVDMGSTDNTLKVAKDFGAKIIKNVPTNNNFDLNRKIGMKAAVSDWVLKLDSDEVLSTKLQNEIKQLLRIDDTGFNGYNLRNKIYMFGKLIKHGFVKARSHELRLFRNNKWRYNPYKFHQQINIYGKIGGLNNYYFHYNVKNVTEFIYKTNQYTNLDAQHYIKKITFQQIISAPLKSFIKLYFWQFGFLDGRIGFQACYLYSLYNLIEKIKAWHN